MKLRLKEDKDLVQALHNVNETIMAPEYGGGEKSLILVAKDEFRTMDSAT